VNEWQRLAVAITVTAIFCALIGGYLGSVFGIWIIGFTIPASIILGHIAANWALKVGR